MIKNFFQFFRNIEYGVENLIVWFPIIWSDRNWDQTFIYTILRHKLDQTQKYFRKYGHHVNSDRDANNMKTCVLILDRLLNDIYHEQAFKKYDKKWGEANFSTFETENPDLYRVIITRENVQTEEDKIKERADFKRAWEHHDYLKKQDLDILFKLMRKHIEGWWD
jgi:hypothetical protein